MPGQLSTLGDLTIGTKEFTNPRKNYASAAVDL